MIQLRSTEGGVTAESPDQRSEMVWKPETAEETEKFRVGKLAGFIGQETEAD
jgi:hypothetical protein